MDVFRTHGGGSNPSVRRLQPAHSPLEMMSDRRPDPIPRHRSSRRAVLFVPLAVLCGCFSPERWAHYADVQSFDILESTAGQVTGRKRSFSIERPVDTLRNRLLTANEPLRLDLKSALDVAAENSREFQTQKESLYRSALSLTNARNNFRERFGHSASSNVNGEHYHGESLSFNNDLSASVNTLSGARLVVGFATNFLESLLSGDNAQGGPRNVLDLTITQPLIQGFGYEVVRAPLTQAERNVVYAMRSYERFRSQFTIQIVQNYYAILSTMENLRSVKANYDSLVKDRLRLVELVKSGRNRAEDLDQARQSELSAENQVINTTARLNRQLDNFKLTLGLPTTTQLTLDSAEFNRLATVSLADLTLIEDYLVDYALDHRFDYRTVRDRVADAARDILVAENTLQSALDFTSAINVPNDASSKPFAIDWDKVNWRAGFNLNLAVDRIPQRNAYRNALIGFEQAIRSREQFEDQVRADVRDSLRNLRALEQSFKIETAGVANAKRRVERTEMFMAAGGRANTSTFDVLLAKEALIRSQLSLTSVLVDFAVAKLQLLRDIEAFPIEPKGLRYDPGLKLPPAAQRPKARPEASDAEADPR